MPLGRDFKILTYTFKKYVDIEEMVHEISDFNAGSVGKFESRFGSVISKYETRQDLGRSPKPKLGASQLPALVGLAGFEPTTPCPPGRCATRLRYSPFRQREAKETGEMRIGKHGKS